MSILLSVSLTTAAVSDCSRLGTRYLWTIHDVQCLTHWWLPSLV